ncbi:MAG: fibronectin type III domain-containing protein [Pirellulales bacterium]|nr:fibronectin type III domain-containing protein [Pirellulales bacterium]
MPTKTPSWNQLWRRAAAYLAGSPTRSLRPRLHHAALRFEHLEQRQLHAITPLSFVEVDPRGWEILDAAIQRSIAVADPQDFTVTLKAGQAISAALSATSSPISLSLTDPSGAVVSTLSLASGQAGVLVPYVAPVGGTFTFRLTNTGGAAGAYALDVALNSGVEGIDSSIASPQSLNNTYTAITGGATRYAYLGSANTQSGSDVDSYTIDLSGAVGKTLDLRVAGRGGADFSGQRLQLFSPGGVLLAEGVAEIDPNETTSRSLVISKYFVPVGGLYTIRLTSQTAGNYGLVVSDSTPTAPLSAATVLNMVVANRWTSKTSVESLVGTVSFDRYFTSLTTDELLRTLLNNNLIRGYSDLGLLKAALPSRHVDLTSLRPDGILTALETSWYDSLLGSGGAAIDATDAKDALRALYAASPTALLDVFTTRELLGLFDDSISSAAGAAIDRMHASGTQATSDSNISTMHQLWTHDTAGNLNTPTPQDSFAATSAQPVGNRTMLATSFLAIDGYGNSDGYSWGFVDPVDSQGQPTDYFLVWMDQWEQVIRARVQSFFTQYKNLGGQLDYFAMDIEDMNFSYWGMTTFERRVNPQVTATRTVWQALQADPRWNALKAELKAAGLTDDDLSLANIGNYNTVSEKASIWNGVLEARFSGYINRAVVQPILALFPNAKILNYGSYYRSTTMPSTEYYAFLDSTDTVGTLIGNRQSKELYGYHTSVYTKDGQSQPTPPFETRIKYASATQLTNGQGQPTLNCLATIQLFTPIPGLKPGDSITIENRGNNWIDPLYAGKWTIQSASADGLTVKYVFTIPNINSVPAAYDLSNRGEVINSAYLETWRSYSAFIADLKIVRTEVGASDVPFVPWVSGRDWLQREYGLNHTYYPETIFHTALSGAEDFLFWKDSADPQVANHTVLNNLLKELDPLVGFEGRKTITFTHAEWDDGYMLTGMEANGRRVYRLTPDPLLSITNLSSGGNVVFRIGGKTVTIPHATLYTPPGGSVSNLGYWIVQTAGANQLTMSADQVAAAVQSALRPQISAPDALVGQAIPVTLSMNSAAFPPGTQFSFDIDWTGDGVVDRTIVGPSGTQVNCSFASPGDYNIVVTASVLGSGQALPAANRQVHVGTLPFTDSFTRADSTSLSTNWSEQFGDLKLQSGKLELASGDMALAIVRGPNTADVVTSANIDLPAGGRIGLVTRYGGPGDDNWYMGRIYYSGSTAYAQMHKSVGGVVTNLGERVVSGAAGTLRFEAVGTSLKLYWNDQLVVSATDAALAVGAVGARLGTGTLDNFSVTLPAAAAANPPTAPTSLTAAAASASQINLAWQHSGAVDRFEILRHNGTQYVVVGTVAAAARAYQDTGLAAGTQYQYQVRAVAADGQTALAQVSATTDSATPPPAGSFVDNFNRPNSTNLGASWSEPVGNTRVSANSLMVEGAGAGMAVLTGVNYTDAAISADVTVPTDGRIGLIARYGGSGDSDWYMARIYNSGSRVYATLYKNVNGAVTNLGEQIVSGDSGAMRFELEGNSLKLYWNNQLAVSAQDNSLATGMAGVRLGVGTLDNFSVTTSGNQVTPPPAAPNNVTATPASATQINLAWQQSGAVDHFDVLRHNGAQYVVVGTVGAAARAFQDTGLAAGTQYQYQVRAVAADGQTALAQVSATTNSVTPPPAATFSDTFNRADSTNLGANWSESLGNAKIVNGQLVNEGGGAGMPIVNSAAVANGSLSADLVLSAGGRMGIIARYGGSGDSDWYMARIYNSGSTVYATLYKNVNGAVTNFGEQVVSGGSGTLRFDLDGDNLKLYWNDQLAVSARDASLATGKVGLRLGPGAVDSFSVNIADQQVAQPPAAPTSVTATAAGNSQINLAWQHSGTVDHFDILRHNGTQYVVVGTVGAAARVYQDTGLAAGTQYQYQVRAVAANGQSAETQVTGATTGAPPAALNFSDSFTRADGTNLGANWTEPLGNAKLVAGQMVIEGASAAMPILASVNVADVSLSADLVVPADGRQGLIARYGGSGDSNWYMARIYNSGSRVYATLYKNVNGAVINLGEQVVTGATGTLRFDLSGDNLKLYWNNQLIINRQDNSLATGKVGLRLGAGAVESFSATSL